MKLIYKKIINVVSGYFASLPFFYVKFNNALLQSLTLCVFFIFYYYILDKLLYFIENFIKKRKRRLDKMKRTKNNFKVIFAEFDEVWRELDNVKKLVKKIVELIAEKEEGVHDEDGFVSELYKIIEE